MPPKDIKSLITNGFNNYSLPYQSEHNVSNWMMSKSSFFQPDSDIHNIDELLAPKENH